VADDLGNLWHTRLESHGQLLEPLRAILDGYLTPPLEAATRGGNGAVDVLRRSLRHAADDRFGR
jgi:hypothetical protein